MYALRNIEARSRNHCFFGKTVSFKNYEFVSILALVIQHARHIFSASCYIVICGLSVSTIFFHIIS